MSLSVTITLTTAGLDTGPFDLYSNADGYASAFETGVSKMDLEAGYASSLVPDAASTIRVKSTGTCTNYVDLPIGGVTPVPSEVTITACAKVHPTMSGQILMYVYASGSGVNTDVQVNLKWTGSALTVLTPSITLTYPTFAYCQSILAGGASPFENGTNFEILSITPASFDGVTYTAGAATLSDTCANCAS